MRHSPCHQSYVPPLPPVHRFAGKCGQGFHPEPCGAAIDRTRRHLRAFRPTRGHTRGHQTRGRIGDHDIPRRARSTAQNSLGNFQIARCVSTLELPGRRYGNSEIARLQGPPLYRAIGDLEYQRGAGGGDLIEAIGAVHHEASPQPQCRQRPRQQLGRMGIGCAHKLGVRPSRVGQRPQQIEYRAQLQIGSHRLRVAHRRMQRRREQKADSHFSNGARCLCRFQRDFNSQRLEQIGAARRGIGNRSVAVLGHMHPGARGHKRSQRRYVKGPRSVPSRSAGVEQRLPMGQVRLHLHRHVPHGPGQAHQLRHRRPLHPHRDHKSRDLRMAGTPFQDHAHGGFRLGSVQVLALHDAANKGQ